MRHPDTDGLGALAVRHVPATRSELLRQGCSDAAIDNRLRRHRLVAAHRGVLLAVDDAKDLRARFQSALSTQDPGACLQGRTAAAVLDLPVAPPRWATTEPIHVAAPREDLSRSRRRGIERHLSLVPDQDICRVAGMAVTTPARTLAELARTEPRLLVLQMADAAVATGRASCEDLAAAAGRFRGLRHVRRAREAMTLVRAGIDSPSETALRLVIVDSGLPEPEVRVELVADRAVMARADLGYRRELIWLEYDGWEVHRQRDSFRDDRHRDRWLSGRGWQVMRVTDRDLRSPRSFLAQLRAALDDAPARVAAMPPYRSPEVAAAHTLLTLGS